MKANAPRNDQADPYDPQSKLDEILREDRRRTAIPSKIELDDFFAYMPEHRYIYIPSGQLWPAPSINSRIPPVDTGEVDGNGNPVTIKPSIWLDQCRPADQMTWAPGLPNLICDRLVAKSGWIARPGARVFNLYLP